MIILTKLDKSPIVVSLESIKFIESMPDTLIFFLNGDSIIVRESLDELIEKTVEFKRKVIGES